MGSEMCIRDSLWRAYDEKLDPMLRGDKSELLKPEGGTVKQLMGISLKAPDPILAPSMMPAFNATDAQKSEVLDKDGQSWIVPTPGADQKPLFLPAPVITSETAKGWPKYWADMKTTWQDKSKAGLALASNVTALGASTLGWDKPMIATLPDPDDKFVPPPGKPVWQLDASLPPRLVTGTAAGQSALGDIADGLQNYYLALPRVSVVA